MPEKSTLEAAPARRPTPAERLRGVVAEEARVVQLIVFRLGDEEFGAEIGQVREIVKAGSVTPIPDSPAFIKGVTNVRGEIVATIDLKARFFLPSSSRALLKHIVITQREDNLCGLMVDEVTEVLRIPETEIKPAPEVVTRLHEGYVSGVVTAANRLLILLDLGKVLSEEELLRLAQLQRSHQDQETGPRPEEALEGSAGAEAQAGRSRPGKRKAR